MDIRMAKSSLDAHTDATNYPVAPRTSPTAGGKAIRYLRTIGTGSMLVALFNQGASFAENLCKRYDAPDYTKYIRYLQHLVNLVVLLFAATRWTLRKNSQRGHEKLGQDQ